MTTHTFTEKATRALFTLMFAVLVVAGVPAFADDTASKSETDTPPAVQAADPATAAPVTDDAAAAAAAEAPATETANAGAFSDAMSKLTVHGYLTQAYGRSDGHQVWGIPEGGTADYRTAALQFRYAMSSKDNFVVQFAHERLGNSLGQPSDDVTLDWGFYERRFTPSTSARVGRIQIPFGLFNEVRDVGTILPFYRAPGNFYFEGEFSSETADGILLKHSFAKGSPWGLDAAVYYGGWEESRSTDPDTGVESISRAEDAIGVQLWLNTPAEWLRVGVSANQHKATNTGDDSVGLGDLQRKNYAVSAEANFNRFVARAEWSNIDLEILRSPAYYVQVGFRATEKLMINAQYDVRQFEIDAIPPFLPEPLTLDFDRDKALGVNYYFRPDLVLKAEMHKSKGINVEDVQINPLIGAYAKTDYVIVSLSTSF